MKRSPLAAVLFVLSLTLLLAGCGSQGTQDTGATSGGSSVQTKGRGTVSAEAANLPDTISTGKIPQPRLQTRPVVIHGSNGEVRVRAEIANDESERSRGLMAREKLGKNEGMLFVFPSEQFPGFYMKNTLLPLSIAYMDSGGGIVDIQDMQPLDETPHPPAKPAQYTLEVNQGFFEAHGVKAGDKVDLPQIVK